MQRHSRTIIGWLGLVAVLLLTGCNTIEGIGEDLSGLGRGISNAASGLQNNL